jgi:hypothetical protein
MLIGTVLISDNCARSMPRFGAIVRNRLWDDGQPSVDSHESGMFSFENEYVYFF